MHLSEVNGKVIKVQLAKPHNITATSHRAGKVVSNFASNSVQLFSNFFFMLCQ